MSFDCISIPSSGERVRYDPATDSFSASGRPIVPVAYGDGVGQSVVPASKRVLDAAAEEMGRAVEWVRVSVGSAAIERYGTPLPEETVRALEQFRLGLVGPPSPSTPPEMTAALRHTLALSTEIQPLSHLAWTPSPVSTRTELDLVCIRDTTEDAAAGLEFEAGSSGASRIREVIETEDDSADLPPDPAGFGVRPVSRATTELLVERAIEYALNRDRNRLTIVYQSDQHPATDGAFRTWATDFLDAEYDDAIVTEAVFDSEYEHYPDDEIVLAERHTDRVCRELLTSPEEYDVLVAPAGAGTAVSTVASEVVGGHGVTPAMWVGDGRALLGAATSGPEQERMDEANPVATMLAGCLLVELLGWEDTAGLVRDGIEATLSDGIVTRDLARRTARKTVVGTEEFTDRVIDHIHTTPDAGPSASVRTTAEERATITEMIVGLYNTLFEDQIQRTDITLNHLRNDDEEADIYLPEVGINFRYWRRWSVERRLEVLVHEFAHVENYDDGHGPDFYDRFVELVCIAEAWESELEVLFDAPIDFERVKRLVVESVHEETIEPHLESVEDRKRALCREFGLTDDGHH